MENWIELKPVNFSGLWCDHIFGLSFQKEKKITFNNKRWALFCLLGPFLSAADCNEQTIQSTVNIDPLPIQPYFDVGTPKIMWWINKTSNIRSSNRIGSNAEIQSSNMFESDILNIWKFGSDRIFNVSNFLDNLLQRLSNHAWSHPDNCKMTLL